MAKKKYLKAGVCPARVSTVAGIVMNEPHEPDEDPIDDLVPTWILKSTAHLGFGYEVKVCKHCQTVYKPKIVEIEE